MEFTATEPTGLYLLYGIVVKTGGTPFDPASWISAHFYPGEILVAALFPAAKRSELFTGERSARTVKLTFGSPPVQRNAKHSQLNHSDICLARHA